MIEIKSENCSLCGTDLSTPDSIKVVVETEWHSHVRIKAVGTTFWPGGGCDSHNEYHVSDIPRVKISCVRCGTLVERGSSTRTYYND